MIEFSGKRKAKVTGKRKDLPGFMSFSDEFGRFFKAGKYVSRDRHYHF
jgi:hypothetical protein